MKLEELKVNMLQVSLVHSALQPFSGNGRLMKNNSELIQRNILRTLQLSICLSISKQTKPISLSAQFEITDWNLEQENKVSVKLPKVLFCQDENSTLHPLLVQKLIKPIN